MDTMAELGRTLEGHTDWVSSVCVSADGSRLFSGSWDNTIKVWDVATPGANFDLVWVVKKKKKKKKKKKEKERKKKIFSEFLVINLMLS